MYNDYKVLNNIIDKRHTTSVGWNYLQIFYVNIIYYWYIIDLYR